MAGEVVATGSFYVNMDFGTGELQPGPAWNGFVVAIESDGTLRFVRELDIAQAEVYSAAIAGDGTIALSGHYHDYFMLDGCFVYPTRISTAARTSPS